MSSRLFPHTGAERCEPVLRCPAISGMSATTIDAAYRLYRQYSSHEARTIATITFACVATHNGSAGTGSSSLLSMSVYGIGSRREQRRKKKKPHRSASTRAARSAFAAVRRRRDDHANSAPGALRPTAPRLLEGPPRLADGGDGRNACFRQATLFDQVRAQEHAKKHF